MILRRTKPTRWMTFVATAALFAVLCPTTLSAQNEDPPGRVARIRYLQGSVSFEPAGESEWVAAVTNRPVTIGDQLWTDASSRAELDLGSAAIRMNADTGFSFLNLDDRTTQVQLMQGVLDLRVRNLNQGEIFEIDTPNQAFSVTQPGEYRVQAAPDGTSTIVIVRKGQGQVTGGGQTYDLNAGQSGTFTGSGTDSLNGQLVDVSAPDDFDRWSELRDRQYDSSQSARYVSRDMVGYEDLDANGTWSNDPTYGVIWTPTSVPNSWAPYRNGHWVWVNPWGWTWVDDDPWGYAPFHYGRWVQYRGRWGWVPGPVNVHPVYAPALVAFIGGSNFAISAAGRSGYGGGDVGWFPLGPREVYVPPYTASRGYVERVNTSNTVVNTTTVTNVYNNYYSNQSVNVTYVNRTVPGAVTAVPQSALRDSTPVARVAVPVDVKRVASAPVAPRAAVAPVQASVLGTTAPARMARPPATVVNRPVVAKTAPPPPPVPFAQQQQELAKHPGQPLPVEQLRPPTVADAHPAVKMAPAAKPANLKPAPTNGSAANPATTPAQQQAQQQAAQQQAEKARQQQAQQQAAQQQAEKARQQQAQQQAAQQQAEKARQQQPQQQAAQQQAQQQAAQQQADKARQQQAAQQQAEKARQQQAQQQAAQQQAEKARQQQAQQQAAQQQAEKARQQQAQQQAAQQQAEKARQQQAQQQAAQQQPEKARQQQAQQQVAQQQPEKARQQQAQQQAAQQQAERTHEQQLAQQRAQQQQARPAQPPQQKPEPQTKPNQPQAQPKEQQKKPEEKQPPK